MEVQEEAVLIHGLDDQKVQIIQIRVKKSPGFL